MKNSRYLIIGGLFFLASLLFIANDRSLLTFLPLQEVELSKDAAFGPLVKDYLFVQEITLKKRYLSRIDPFLARIPGQGVNENVFVLLDSSLNILYTRRFSSGEIDGAVYLPFDLNKSVDLGKGNKVFACIYSLDGDMNNYLALARKADSKLGKLYVATMQNNDVIETIRKKQSVIAFEGSMGVKSYESDSVIFSPLRSGLYILTLIFTLIILFFGRIKPFVLRSVVRPEYAFLGLSLIFGLGMVVVTPPFQVPDEPSHLYRACQISELNLFKYKDDVPQSLVDLSAICNRMKFMAHEKTSRREILALYSIKLNPGTRAITESPNYILPYLPQALGLFIGNLFNLAPLWMLYLGRLFNLLASIVILFFAIRTTPVMKWLFFLLSIMPMTLYQLGSLSYDAMTISLSFLMISVILNMALNEDKVIRTKDLFILFLIALALASAKPPYYILAFTFLIIPMKKFGSWKKFWLTFAGLAATVLIVSQLYSPGRQFFEKFRSAETPVPVTSMVSSPEKPTAEVPQPSPAPEAPEKVPAQAESNTQQTTTQPASQPQQQPAPQAPTVAYNPFDPPAQIKYILDDPIRYMGVILDTFGKFIGLYQISFIGLFGWVDTPLPPFMVYSYLLVLLIIALTTPTKRINLVLWKKGILLGLFLAGFILIETAMYVYCNPVGSNPITAVQGRYFIAFGPLLFLLFYNHDVVKVFERGLFRSKPKSVAGKPKPMNAKSQPFAAKRNQKLVPAVKADVSSDLYLKLVPWLLMGFGIFALTYSLYRILARFYIVLI